MDVLVLGLCGVVAIATTIETAQAIYRHAKRVYRKVDAWLNPSTPSAEMAKAADDLAAALAIAADVAEAQAEAKALPLSVAEPVPDFWLEPMPFTHTPPVFGKVWNPAPGRNMHEEVERLLELQHVPLTLAAAAEPVKQPTRKGRGQTKAAAAPAIAEDELVMALDVPGAIGGKRQLRAKVGASKAAAAKPKEARARAKTGARAGVK